MFANDLGIGKKQANSGERLQGAAASPLSVQDDDALARALDSEDPSEGGGSNAQPNMQSPEQARQKSAAAEEVQPLLALQNQPSTTNKRSKENITPPLQRIDEAPSSLKASEE